MSIPPDKLDFAFRLIKPETFLQGGSHDFIMPIIADAVIIHADETETFVIIRDYGKNPAVVTVDGRRYFFAAGGPDIHAGAMQLLRLVREISAKDKQAK